MLSWPRLDIINIVQYKHQQSGFLKLRVKLRAQQPETQVQLIRPGSHASTIVTISHMSFSCSDECRRKKFRLRSLLQERKYTQRGLQFKTSQFCQVRMIQMRIANYLSAITNNQIQMKATKELARIQVVIRKRPINEKELANGETDIVVIKDRNRLMVREPKLKVDLTPYIDEHKYVFDEVYSEQTTNQQLYLTSVRPILLQAFSRTKVSIFAYGQTGSGKTYTMNGNPSKDVMGIYTYAGHDIFNTVKNDPAFRHLKVKCQFFEIYCGKVYDLLNSRNDLPIRQDSKGNINIIGTTDVVLDSVQSYSKCIRKGMNLRITSQNGTNSQSSRSHAILQISIYDGKNLFTKLSFIDLAGCQRGADTLEQSKQTKVDGSEINKSLLALKECIRALDKKIPGAHIPFRSSKLTMILRDSLMDNCKTLMIGNISPGSLSCENTLNTLRYSERVKDLKKGFHPTDLCKQDLRARELGLTRLERNKVSVNLTEEELEVYANKGRASQSNEKNQRFSTSQENRSQLANPWRRLTQSPKSNVEQVSPNRLTINCNPVNSGSKNHFSIRRLHPMTAEDYRMWNGILEEFQNFSPFSLEHFEYLFIQSKEYLEREFNSYVCMQEESTRLQNEMAAKQRQIWQNMYNNFENFPNQTMYTLSAQLRSLKSKRAEMIANTASKLKQYQSYLFKHQFCQQKLDSCAIQNRDRPDDQVSLIDEINSEAMDDVSMGYRFQNGYQQNQRTNPSGRQSAASSKKWFPRLG